MVLVAGGFYECVHSPISDIAMRQYKQYPKEYLPEVSWHFNSLRLVKKYYINTGHNLHCYVMA